MDSQIGTKKRAVLYAIGAGTLLLALMAFSALCFGVVHVCHRWLTMAALSFWEILGVSIASFFGFIAIRSIRRRRANDSISRRLRAAAELHSSNEVRSCSELRSCGEGRSTSWRDLYDQLSEEERLEMKAMMKKYCSGADSQADGECGAKNTDPASPHLP